MALVAANPLRHYHARVEPIDSLERLIPAQIHDEDRAATESLELHRARYAFAASQANSGPLLDMACGVGYGTRLIADERPEIAALLGVDISTPAVDYALRQYACDRVSYTAADAMSFQPGEANAAGFDTIVSLETIEHLPDPEAFFARLPGLLTPGGVLIASVPVTPSVDLNPHHLHDFTAPGFRDLGKRNGLVEIASHTQVQRVALRDVWNPDRRFQRDHLRPNLLGYYVSHPGALLRRVLSTLRFGLANHYLTIAWKKGG